LAKLLVFYFVCNANKPCTVKKTPNDARSMAEPARARK